MFSKRLVDIKKGYMKKLIPLIVGEGGLCRLTRSELLRMKSFEKGKKMNIKRAFLTTDDFGISCVEIKSFEVGVDDILLRSEDVEKLEKKLGIK